MQMLIDSFMKKKGQVGEAVDLGLRPRPRPQNGLQPHVLVAGWFSDFTWVDSLLVTNLAILFSGVSTLVLPLCTSYGAFVTIALLFGFFVAAYISLTSIILVDLLGLDNLTSAFGLLVLYRGVSSMVGPPVAGAVYDATKSYDISFYMAGGFLVVASLISFAAQALQRKKQNKAKEDKK